MPALANSALKNLQQTAAQGGLDGGFMYFFAGSVPESSGEALDMATDHTECFKLSVGGDGVTGLALDGPVDGVLSKPAGDTWEGPVDFSGTTPGPGVLTPTFYRLCGPGDDGRGASSPTQPRLQDTVGGPASDAAVRLGTDTVEDNGSNTQGLSGWTYSLGTP
jgi:hypothetical protein